MSTLTATVYRWLKTICEAIVPRAWNQLHQVVVEARRALLVISSYDFEYRTTTAMSAMENLHRHEIAKRIADLSNMLVLRFSFDNANAATAATPRIALVNLFACRPLHGLDLPRATGGLSRTHCHVGSYSAMVCIGCDAVRPARGELPANVCEKRWEADVVDKQLSCLEVFLTRVLTGWSTLEHRPLSR